MVSHIRERERTSTYPPAISVVHPNINQDHGRSTGHNEACNKSTKPKNPYLIGDRNNCVVAPQTDRVCRVQGERWSPSRMVESLRVQSPYLSWLSFYEPSSSSTLHVMNEW